MGELPELKSRFTWTELVFDKLLITIDKKDRINRTVKRLS